MRHPSPSKLAAVVVALSLAPIAAAQSDATAALSPETGSAAPRRLRLAVGLERRAVFEYFYFYPGGYAETEGSTIGVAVEGSFLALGGERTELAVGLSLAAGTGSGDFSSSGTSTASEDLFTLHAEAFGEGGFRVIPQVALLGRLGLGYTGVMHDSADEGFTNLLLGLGARLALGSRLGIAAIYQFQLAELGGTTDAGVTSAEPSLENHDNSAILLRAVFSM